MGKSDDEGEGADDHDAKTKVQDEKKRGASDKAKPSGDSRAPDGFDLAPEVTITIHGTKHRFDIDDPELPDWVKDNQFSAGDYPYDHRLKRKRYEAELEALQGELVKMQGWLEASGSRVIALFEGRDAAGKGGVIQRVRENMNPRRARIVALTAPDETERGQWYYQRYISHFPTAGEMVLFDRSWYNRGVVEPVMGYCTMPQHRHFLEHTPGFERQVVADGIILLKFWLNIGRETQLQRFHDRRHNPLKLWKLSPNDIKSLSRWDDYTAARDRTIEATNVPEAPWVVVRANDKRRARLNLIRSLLLRIPYENRDDELIGEPDPRIVGEGLDVLRTSGE